MAVLTSANEGQLVMAHYDAAESLANMVLLLHCDGEDASTTITDELGHTVTAAGNAQLDTAQYKLGTASLLCDGTNDYAYAADSDDWDFGTGDFTIQFFVRFNSVASGQTLIAHGGRGNDVTDYAGWKITWFTNNTLYWGLQLGSTSYAKTFAWTPVADTWYHVALCRVSGVLRAFVDGVQIGSDQSVTQDINQGAYQLKIGTAEDGSQDFNGWLDEICIHKGQGLYSTTFTPPAEPFGAVVKDYRLRAKCAANSVMGNATASAAAPSDIAIAEERLLGRITGGNVVGLTQAQVRTFFGYAEGTFTPTIYGTTTAGTGTYTSQLGYYTRIGQVCFFHVALVITAHTGSGNMRIGGLPFTSMNVASIYSCVSVGSVSAMTLPADTALVARVGINDTYIFLQTLSTAGGDTTGAALALDTACSIFLSGHYIVA